MSESAIVAGVVIDTIRQIADQASALGVGLQNAAPGDKAGMPNNSVQYLLETSKGLYNLIKEFEPSPRPGLSN